MVVGRDVGQRARLARLLNGGGYRVEIAESVSHACRIGFAGIALAIVAPDGLGPAGRGLIQDLRAAVGTVLLVGAPGRQRERRSDLLDISDEAGLLARVAEALAPRHGARGPGAGAAIRRIPARPRRPHPDGSDWARRFRSRMASSACCAPSCRGRDGCCPAINCCSFCLGVTPRPTTAASICRSSVCAGRSSRTQAPNLDRHHPEQRLQVCRQCAAGGGGRSAGAGTAATPPEVRPAAAERRYVTALAAEVLAAEGSSLPGDPEELRSSSMPIAATLALSSPGMVG